MSAALPRVPSSSRRGTQNLSLLLWLLSCSSHLRFLVLFSVYCSLSLLFVVVAAVVAKLRITEAPIDGVALAWRDRRKRYSAVPAGAVPTSADIPIMPRRIMLDLPQLSRGEYIVEVGVESPGRRAIRVSRPITSR